METRSHAEKAIPDRLYFRIGDVADLVGVKPYVLRYWETEFPMITPQKSASGQRVYRRSDVETVLMIKHLLYEERYSIDGARRRIRELRREGELKNFRQETAVQQFTQPSPSPKTVSKNQTDSVPTSLISAAAASAAAESAALHPTAMAAEFPEGDAEQAQSMVEAAATRALGDSYETMSWAPDEIGEISPSTPSPKEVRRESLEVILAAARELKALADTPFSQI